MSDSGTIDTGTGIMPGVEPSAYQQRQAAAAAAAANAPGEPAPQGTVYTQAEVDALLDERLKAVREQEKGKLYDRVKKAEEQTSTVAEQLAAIQAERDAEAARAAEADNARLAAEQAAEEAKMSATDLANKVRGEFQTRFEEMNAAAALERATFEKERQFQAIEEYKRNQLAVPEIAAQIHPAMHPYITGSTPEEIDAAIARVTETSNAVLSEAQAAFQQQQLAYQQQRFAAPGTMPTGGGSGVDGGPVDPNTQPRQLTKADIDAMSPAEWAAVRGQVLPQANPYRR